MLRTLMPRKARHTVHSETERASGAIKRLLAFLNRISMIATEKRGRSREELCRVYLDAWLSAENEKPKA